MVSGWLGWVAERPTRATPPPAEQSGPKVFVVKYADRGSLMPSPIGQANRKACCWWYGEKIEEEANAVL